MYISNLILVVFMNLINAFQAFGQIKLLTQGGPGDSTNVLVHSIYREAFFNGRFERNLSSKMGNRNWLQRIEIYSWIVSISF